MLLLSQDIADKTQVLFIGHIILHNDNKKISIELKEGIFMAVTNNIREIREQRGIYQNDLARCYRIQHQNCRQDRAWGQYPICRIYAADIKVL